MKLNKHLVFLFLLYLSGWECVAEESQWEVALGAKYISALQKRGIITYQGFQLTPIFSVKPSQDQFLLAGTELYYKQELGDSSRFRLRLNFNAANDSPLYETEECSCFRVERKLSTEVDAFYEVGSSKGSHLLFLWSQGIMGHTGFYTEAHSHLAIYDFRNPYDNKVLLQPAVFFTVGGGSRVHNEYLYGEGAGSYGVSQWQYGVAVTSPEYIDQFWPTLRFSHFEILGSSNRNASFVKETKGWQLELLMAFRVL